jgi:hypothetical protein
MRSIVYLPDAAPHVRGMYRKFIGCNLQDFSGAHKRAVFSHKSRVVFRYNAR